MARGLKLKLSGGSHGRTAVPIKPLKLGKNMQKSNPGREGTNKSTAQIGGRLLKLPSEIRVMIVSYNTMDPDGV